MIDFMVSTARDAGKIILDHFGRARQIHTKSDRGDVVTEADLRSDDLIVSRIRGAFPGDGILTEEAGELIVSEGKRTWVVDPLDGTRNFSREVPFFCVSIALVENGRPIAGVVHDPVHDETFQALLGEGAFLGCNPLEVSTEHDLESALVNVAWTRKTADGRSFAPFAAEIVERTNYTRRYGSAALALAYTAAGRVHSTVLVDIKTWDVAAGILLVSEAGGLVTGLRGEPIILPRKSIDLLASNPSLHRRMMTEIFGA